MASSTISNKNWKFVAEALSVNENVPVNLSGYSEILVVMKNTSNGNVKMIKASELLTQIHDVVDNIPTVYEQGDQWGAWNGKAFDRMGAFFVSIM